MSYFEPEKLYDEMRQVEEEIEKVSFDIEHYKVTRDFEKFKDAQSTLANLNRLLSNLRQKERIYGSLGFGDDY